MDKRVIGLFLFLSIGVLFSSCNLTSNDEPDPLEVTFEFFDMFGDDKLVVRPDNVMINGEDLSFDDFLGGFSVKLKPGTYPVTVENTDHITLDTTVTIVDSTTFYPLELQSKTITYFDPEVGEKWVFDYRDFVSYPNHDKIETLGVMTWEIIEKNIQPDTSEPIFTVRNHLDAKKRRESFEGVPIDSSYIDNFSSFTITLRNNGNIAFSTTKYVWNLTAVSATYIDDDYFESPVRQTYPLSRINTEDQVIRFEYGEFLNNSRIAPGVGFTNYSRSILGNTKFSTSISLISHSK